MVEDLGGRILKPGQKNILGGYGGYFADPDGFLREVAYNPSTPNLITRDFHLPDCEQPMAKKILTIDQGVPVTDNPGSLPAGKHWPVLFQDIHLIEKQEMTL
jgi:hypothetical protein